MSRKYHTDTSTASAEIDRVWGICHFKGKLKSIIKQQEIGIPLNSQSTSNILEVAPSYRPEIVYICCKSKQITVISLLLPLHLHSNNKENR